MEWEKDVWDGEEVREGDDGLYGKQGNELGAGVWNADGRMDAWSGGR